MKKRISIALLLCITTSSFLFSQEPKDTSKEISIYPQFSSFLSEEESWELHKEAFKKQLKSKGLSEKEIEAKMVEYEKQKEEEIEQIKTQRRLAEKHRKLAEIQRKRAEELRRSAAIQREEAKELRQQAEGLRRSTIEHRKEAAKLRQNAAIQREHANELRSQAAEQRKLAEEWRKSTQNIYRETIQFQKDESKEKLIKIKIKEKSTLFFNIDGVVNSGKIMIQLFSPSGKKEGELTLEDRQLFSSTVKHSNRVSGSLNKTINASEKGDWVIKIVSEKSESTINVSVAKRVKTKTND